MISISYKDHEATLRLFSTDFANITALWPYSQNYPFSFVNLVQIPRALCGKNKPPLVNLHLLLQSRYHFNSVIIILLHRRAR